MKRRGSHVDASGIAVRSDEIELLATGATASAKSMSLAACSGFVRVSLERRL